MSVVKNINLNCSSHDELLVEQRRLLQLQDDFKRYIANLSVTRSDLYRHFVETKNEFIPARYRRMGELIGIALISYQDIIRTKETDMRNLDRESLDLLNEGCLELFGDRFSADLLRMDSFSFLDQRELSVKRQNALCVIEKHKAMSTAELHASIRSLQLAVTRLQETFRAECLTFQKLAKQYNACTRYTFIHRYIAIKCIIKIASKSDL